MYCCVVWPRSQKYYISIARDCCLLIELFTIPTHVALSKCTGICGCGCPISYKINRSVLTSFTFRNNAPSSASAADVATSLRIAHVMAIVPFSLIGVPCLGKLPRKKESPAWRCPHPADRYEVSE